MKRIGLISDTHSYLSDAVFEHFKDVDEIWHAGDIGSLQVIDQLEAFKPCQWVYGNIDNHEIRAHCPLDNIFMCEEVKVWMTHIGGYPGRYSKRIKEQMPAISPHLFVCGHSHILKVIYDKKYQLLTMNPGAYGRYGFHTIRTLLRFTIDGKDIKSLEIIESKR